MTNQSATFSVLSTPVALCDRRALSEAWYSALHMHKTSALAPQPARSPGAARSHEAANPFARSRTSTLCAQSGIQSMAVRVGAAAALPGPPPLERRTLGSKLAQNIERTFARAQAPPKHASFALEGGHGRVQILLRESQGGTQIIALCPPAARALVSRALSQARYALALRGISLGSEVHGFVR